MYIIAIYHKLQKKSPFLFRERNANMIGKLLTSMEVVKICTKFCCYYRMVPLV